MDLLALLAVLFEIGASLPRSRVTVKQRYEMKKKVRELKRREQQRASKK